MTPCATSWPMPAARAAAWSPPSSPPPSPRRMPKPRKMSSGRRAPHTWSSLERRQFDRVNVAIASVLSANHRDFVPRKVVIGSVSSRYCLGFVECGHGLSLSAPGSIRPLSSRPRGSTHQSRDQPRLGGCARPSARPQYGCSYPHLRFRAFAIRAWSNPTGKFSLRSISRRARPGAESRDHYR
jgi:hypothetical protein